MQNKNSPNREGFYFGIYYYPLFYVTDIQNVGYSSVYN